MLHFERCVKRFEQEIVLPYPISLKFGSVQEIMKFIQNKPGLIIKTLKIYEADKLTKELRVLNELEIKSSEEVKKLDQLKTEFFAGLNKLSKLDIFTEVILDLQQVTKKEIWGLASLRLPNLTKIQFNKIGLEDLKALKGCASYFFKLTNISIESNNDEILEEIVPLLETFPKLEVLDVKYDKFAPREHQSEDQKIAKYCSDNEKLHVIKFDPSLCVDLILGQDAGIEFMGNSMDQMVPSI